MTNIKKFPVRLEIRPDVKKVNELLEGLRAKLCDVLDELDDVLDSPLLKGECTGDRTR